ncbi:Asp23/Gls24 family envelope stress response protein [Gulosibacter faecalis]|jgi:hypothetical protein|uniref:NTP pyrophosphohydrolase n=1 Tax=Gulosibacter faecalis TaxID=272240 RepID=A0ABW5V0B4_9MICO|nr:hypothetical protein [Gulosibacter faecalis]
MSASTAIPAPAPNSAPEAGVSGRIHVRERAIEKAIREASADTIGVPRADVSVEVSEYGGGIAVRVGARLPIPDLADTEAIAAGKPLLERVREAQSDLASMFARVTGREVRRVAVTVTGARIPERKRVK